MNAGASPQAAAQASRQASANGRGTAKRTLAGRRMAVLQAALRVRTHRAIASPDEQDAHTRHVGTAWRHQSDGISRRGEGVPDGTAGEAAAFDLRHQTLALARNRLRVRRSPAGAQQLPWRSGARRLDSVSWSGAEGGHQSVITETRGIEQNHADSR